MLEIDIFLQGHACGAGAVVSLQQFFAIVYFVHVFPAAAGIGFQERRPADVIQQPIPIDGIVQIPQRLRIDVDIRRIRLLRKQNRLGNIEAQFRGDRIVEKLVVRGPPERIVDHISSLQHRMLQVGAVIIHFVGDAVDDDAVLRELAHFRAAEFHEFGGNAVFLAQLVHLFNEGWRETVLPAAHQSNFHDQFPFFAGVLRYELCGIAADDACIDTPARVSATMWRTTSFRSPVCLYMFSWRSALVPSRKIW